MATGMLERNLFSFYMTYNPFSTIDKSEVVFGYIPEHRYLGQLNWHKVTTKKFWTVHLDEILHNGKSLNLCTNKKCAMTPDSGTTYMTMPSKIYRSFSK
jgi:hypothetical protein